MSLKDERNAESIIIWDCLFCAELIALFGNNTNEERAKYLKRMLKKYRSKNNVYKSLNKVVKSTDISSYVFAVGTALVDIN